MRRYMIIAIAILAAILVMSLVKLLQDRRARAHGEEIDTHLIGLPAVVGALAGLAVFFLGVVMLEHGSAAPAGHYQPAQIKEGKVLPGGFSDDNKATPQQESASDGD